MNEDWDEETERKPGTCVGCGAESAQGLCRDCEMWCEIEGHGLSISEDSASPECEVREDDCDA